MSASEFPISRTGSTEGGGHTLTSAPLSDFSNRMLGKEGSHKKTGTGER